MEKLLILFEFHTVFPYKCAVLAATQRVFPVEWQKQGAVEKCGISSIFFDIFRLFHKSFPPAAILQVTKRAEKTREPAKRATKDTQVLKSRTFVNCFSTPQESAKRRKIRHIYTFRGFPQFPQALLILLFNHYIILSL